MEWRKNMNKQEPQILEITNITKLGVRGQFVIPAKIRKNLNIQKGDYLVFSINERNAIEVHKL